jgi:hypothetical protein
VKVYIGIVDLALKDFPGEGRSWRGSGFTPPGKSIRVRKTRVYGNLIEN